MGHQQQLAHNEQIHHAGLAMAQYHHRMKMASIVSNSAKEGMQLHDAFGAQALQGALNDMMDGGSGDPEYMRQVAQMLHQNGRSDVDNLYDQTATDWQ
jgi:hypothetical protein